MAGLHGPRRHGSHRLVKRLLAVDIHPKPLQAAPRPTPEQIAQVHPSEALRADLDATVSLHERTNPNPYLRVSKNAIRGLADRLKASIDRPMTRRQFLPLVMELQAGYRSDHYIQPVPREDLEAALARGERLLPFRAQPQDDGLVVVAVAQSERTIEPGDTIVRIGSLSAAVQPHDQARAARVL